MAITPDVIRFRGDDWSGDNGIAMTVTRTDDAGNVAPFPNLDTAEIVATIKKRSGVIWTGTKTSNRVIVTDNAAGKIRIDVPRVDTATIAPGIYPMDAEVTTAAEARVTPTTLYIQVAADVTTP